MHLFHPGTSRFYPDVPVDVAATSIEIAGEAEPVAIADLVLLPQTAFADCHSKPIFLADVLTWQEGDAELTYIVGPLPGCGEVASSFTLRGFSKRTGDLLERLPGEVEATPELLAKMVVDGNLYADREKYIPDDTIYCYVGLRITNNRLETLTCPFWQHSDHGIVYCGLLQLGSLDPSVGGEADRQKALSHFGSQDAVDEVDELMLLWDQVKECGVSLRDYTKET